MASNPDSTYELIGPNVQGNAYGCKSHHLMDHRHTKPLVLSDLSFSFEGLRSCLAQVKLAWHDVPLGPHPIEGFVFWGPEGPVAKIKRRDFGLPWPVKENAGK